MKSFPPLRVPPAFLATLRRLQIPASRFLLAVHVRSQTMRLFERVPAALGPGLPFRVCPPFSSPAGGRYTAYRLRREFRISTSVRGVGQVVNSYCTPLGLHRVARKIGGGQPPGTVFRGRVPVGLTWQGMPLARIAHRILWLEGLEPGFNRGGHVDSFRRTIYIHGVGNETTLGQPDSQGCIHVAAAELLPLYDALPAGTLVWIEA